MSFGAALETAGAGNRAALLPYLMAGLPDAQSSVELFQACAAAGADGFEIGIPYADPLMDGPVIQRAGSLALAGGMTLGRGLEVVAAVKEATGLPCAVMTYANPVLRRGAAEFAGALAASGGDALIVADLPVDESAGINEACREAGIHLVQFAAPTTPDSRLDAVVAAGPPFVYAIAEMGVTGERERASDHAAALVARIRARSDLPVVLGVGISTPDAAHSAARLADGVIVGTALVRRVLEADSVAAAGRSLQDAVEEFSQAMTR